MKISIVIPAYNEEHSLAATLERALEQQYPDFEIIVVDNASTDATADIARRYPVRLMHESRKGLLYARERGYKEARGEIIANMDADCLPHPDWLTRGAGYFSHPRIVAVSGPYDYYDAPPLFRLMSRIVQATIYPLMNSIFQLRFIHRGALLIGGNTFLRKSALDAAGGYNTTLTFYGEDTDTARRMAAQGRVRFIGSFHMPTSARRFKREGFIKITSAYIYYFFKIMFTKRSNEKT